MVRTKNQMERAKHRTYLYGQRYDILSVKKPYTFMCCRVACFCWVKCSFAKWFSIQKQQRIMCMNYVGRTTAFKREKKAQTKANPRVKTKSKSMNEHTNMDSSDEQSATIIADCHYLLHWLCSALLGFGEPSAPAQVSKTIITNLILSLYVLFNACTMNNSTND